MPADPHPTDAELRAYGLGRLSDAVSSTVEDHLTACDDCRGRMSSLSGDSFLKRMRAAAPGGTVPQAGDPNGTVPQTGDPLGTALPAPRADDDPTAVLSADGQYADVKELGRGGMGSVYLARNVRLDRPEVLKVVRRELLDKPGAGDRFVREMQAAARLAHPNIVTAYAAPDFGGQVVFAMEYVPGQDLEQLVKQKGPLRPATACYYAYQVALGLQHAHERGLVHRDIKPSNLMLQTDGKKRTVKILDFGLAKATNETRTRLDRTGDGMMLGTPLYMAPEQAADAATADIRADVYALGGTLYYLLTGRPPYQAAHVFDLWLLHRDAPPPDPRAVRPELPAGLTAVVARLMAKRPADRYPTPAAAAAALRPFFQSGGRGSAASVDVLPELDPPAAAPPRRPRWAWAVGVALAVALVGSGLYGVLLKLKTPDGYLVVETTESDAELLIDGQTVTVKWTDGQTAEVKVRPGTHQVQVRKDGFVASGKEVTVEPGPGKRVSARLELKPIRPPPFPGQPIQDDDDGRPAGAERNDNALGLVLSRCPPGKGVGGFWIGRYEVTQAEWTGLMGATPSRRWDKGNGSRYPVYNVSHSDALAFCRKLTDRERAAGRLPKGRAYRLPTDTQWEYACRAGSVTATAFGDALDSTQANFNGDWPLGTGPKGPHRQAAVPVGSFRPNAWDIYDMHGNVGEWVANPGWHRGGSWWDNGRNCSSAIVIPDPPTENVHVGFRVALVPE